MSGSWVDEVAAQEDIDEEELAVVSSIDSSTVEHAVPVCPGNKGFNVDNAALVGGGHNNDWYCVLNSTDGDDVNLPTGIRTETNRSNVDAVPG